MLYGSYLKTGFRNLLTSKVFTFFNLLGLSLALAFCILEYSFYRLYNSMDSFHVKADRIFMLASHADRDGSLKLFGDTPAGLGPALKNIAPVVESVVRVHRWEGTILDNDRTFYETVRIADPEFFHMFSFPLESGDATLSDKQSAVVSRDFALKLFGSSDCIGKPIEIQFSTSTGQVRTITFVVKAVARPLPDNASFGFSIVVPWDVLTDLAGKPLEGWAQPILATFVMTYSPADRKALESQQEALARLQREANPDWPVKGFHVEPLTTLSLNSPSITGDIAKGVGPASRTVMAMLSMLLLFLAVFNFVNMALTKSTPRLKEIGYRKVTGASRLQLISQFLTENALFSFACLATGVALAIYVLLPGFSTIGPLKLALSPDDPWLWVFLFGIWAATTLGGAAYPAFYISRFNPIGIFQGRVRLGSGNLLMHLVLCFQLILSFATVIAGVVMIQQERYTINKDWGYTPDQLIVVPLPAEKLFAGYRNALAARPSISSVTGSVHQPGYSFQAAQVFLGQESLAAHQFDVDFRFMEDLRFRLTAGRLFDERMPSDSINKIVVNQMLVRSLNLKTPIGTELRVDTLRYEIIGVVEDFHYQDFFKDIQPVFFRVASPDRFRFATITVEGDNLRETYDAAATQWAKMYPDYPFAGIYQTDVFDGYFEIINAHALVMLVTTIIGILLSATGLFGSVSLRLSARLKELGIRKVLGAAQGHLAFILSRDLLVVLSIAILVAGPLTLYGMAAFLDRAYRYHVEVGVASVVFSIGGLAFVVLSTLQSLLRKAMNVNPAELLKAE